MFNAGGLFLCVDKDQLNNHFKMLFQSIIHSSNFEGFQLLDSFEASCRQNVNHFLSCSANSVRSQSNKNFVVFHECSFTVLFTC